jgi:hypothetical protein
MGEPCHERSPTHARTLRSPLAAPGVIAPVSASVPVVRSSLTGRESTRAEFEGYLRTVNNRDGRPYEEQTISTYLVGCGPSDICHQARSQSVRMNRAECRHIWHGDQRLQPVPPDCYARHGTRVSHGKRALGETRQARFVCRAGRSGPGPGRGQAQDDHA